MKISQYSGHLQALKRTHRLLACAHPPSADQVSLSASAPPARDSARLARTQASLALQAACLPQPMQPLRGPEAAVQFVHRFNSEMELPAPVLARRNEITVSSPAKFFRVNPALFYEDVLGDYYQISNLIPQRKAPELIVAGDCHLGNFGTMRAVDGSTFWGINDFDMAGRGTPEDDLERMATSLHLMSPLSAHDCHELIEKMAQAYFDECARLVDCPPSDHGGIPAEEADGVVADLIAAKSQETQGNLLSEFTEGDRFKASNPELRPITREECQLLEGFLRGYDAMMGPTPELVRPLEVLDLARKLDSGGSTFGLNRFFILVRGKDGQPRILDMKQQLPTAPEQNTGDLDEANAEHIFACMAALGGTFDPTMGYGTLDGKAYYIRERQREKGSLNISQLKTRAHWEDLVEQASLALARAHAHQPGAAAAITQWVGQDRPLAVQRLQNFARVYAQQTILDCAAYKQSLTGLQALVR